MLAVSQLDFIPEQACILGGWTHLSKSSWSFHLKRYKYVSMDFSIGYRVSRDERLSIEVFATHPCTETGEIRIQDA